MMKPWRTVSREQLTQWIREAALLAWMDSYDMWLTNRLKEGWSEEEANEFLETFSSEISKEKIHLVDWLNVNV